MKKKIIYLVIILIIISISISMVGGIKNIPIRITISYEDYIEGLDQEYGEDKDKILNKLNEEILNTKNSKQYIGINLLVREHYFYTWKQTDNLIKNIEETEDYLKRYNMDYELLYLYELVSNTYISNEYYNEAYIYINKGENIAKSLYEKYEEKDILSTLTAIKYLKAAIAIDIGMEKQADVVFNEAEELRKQGVMERVDIYCNIMLYYYNKKEYPLIEEYASKLIDLIKVKDPELKIYEKYYLRANRILAENYINLGDINKCLEITNELTNYKNTFSSRSSSFGMYYLYGKIYKYYGDSEEYIKHLKLAYEEIIDSNLKVKKIKIVELIIQELKISGNNDELLDWYKVENELIINMHSFLDTQYLLSELIDTELQNANSNIEILELQKSKMIYFIITLLLTTTIIIIAIIVEKKHKKLLKENILILEKNDLIKQQYYENIKENHENIKSIKHDIKNHIILVNKLMRDKEFEQTKKYIQGIEKRIDNNWDFNTNNKIIDAIVFNKLETCKLEGINLELDIKIPREIPMDEFDICVIYGNLLDNAIESCKKINNGINKYIKLKTLIKGDYLFLNIKNSSVEKISLKEGNFITTKKDKSNHGIGINSIKNSVNKYGGEVKIDFTEFEFNVSIIINISKNDKIIQ